MLSFIKSVKFYLRLLPLIILAFCSSLTTYAQSDTSFLNRAITSLEKYKTTLPIEKVYLHVDKSSYYTGDTIWYKAYTVAGLHHQLSALSGVLYVELIGPADTVLARQNLRLTSGITWSDMPIPAAGKPGNYYIRAYTNWMRNAGADHFFYKKIHVSDYSNDVVAANKVAASNPDVQFFPEGGELVYGLRTKVAVKAINVKGLGQDIRGSVIDNDGDVIVDFETQHLGMGAFAFTPQVGKTYKAKIVTDKGETSFNVDLPKPAQKGFSMGINNRKKDSIYIKLAANEALFKEKQHSKFYITAQTGGKVYYATSGTLEDMIFTAAVDKKRFPSGIVQFTLFSDTEEPLNERSAFVLNNDTLKLGINTISGSTARQKMQINLNSKNPAGQNTQGAFSVAVINESIIDDDEPDGNILSNLLLTSELKGTVEKPGYYFTNPNEQTNADLDVLMLTQGYQHFEWKTVLAGTAPVITYLPQTGLELSGTVKTFSGKLVPNGKVSLIATKDSLLTDTTLDSKGNFKFTDLDLSDSAKVILSAKKINNGNMVDIFLSKPDIPEIVNPIGGTETHNIIIDSDSLLNKFSVNYKRQINQQLKNIHQLNEVTIKASKKRNRPKPDVTNSANLNGPGMADQIISAEQLNPSTFLNDGLLGMVRGVVIKKEVAYSYLVIMHTPSGSSPPPMVLIINGALQRGGFGLNDILTNSVKTVEVLTSKQFLGIYGGDADGGALVVTLKTGAELASTIPSSGTLKLYFNGFYKAKEFYSPKYDNPKANTQIADLRSTVYWNPNIITDKDGKATFEYFNADTKGTYKVVVEGIDDDGNLGRLVYRYKVE